MPYSRITTSAPLENEEHFLTEYHNTLCNVLQIPEYDRLIHMQHGSFTTPTNCDGPYLLFEISLFKGRSIEIKRKLYAALISLAGKFNIKAQSVRIILYEEPRENWGIRGGVPASDLDLGFSISI